MTEAPGVMRLCGGTLTIEEPAELVGEYVGGNYAWPAYDELVTNGSTELVTGDLLAPALLDVYLDFARFRTLERMLPTLNARLAALPPVALEDADDGTVRQVAELFAALDESGFSGGGVRGTIVSKVLHRKRPALVPLYDSRIWTAYAVTGPVPRVRDGERTWVDFMELLCRQMRADLVEEAAGFAALQDVAAEHGARLTRLRLLDILVWMSTHAPL